MDENIKRPSFKIDGKEVDLTSPASFGGEIKIKEGGSITVSDSKKTIQIDDHYNVTENRNV